MILISKDERDRLVKKMPEVYIRRTMKGKSERHKYYVEETDKVLQALKEIRRT